MELSYLINPVEKQNIIITNQLNFAIYEKM